MKNLSYLIAIVFILMSAGCGGGNQSEGIKLVRPTAIMTCDFCGKTFTMPTAEPSSQQPRPCVYTVTKYIQGEPEPLVGHLCSTGCAVNWIERWREES